MTEDNQTLLEFSSSLFKRSDDRPEVSEWQLKKIKIEYMNSSTNNTRSKCYHCDLQPPIINESDPRRHKCPFCKQWYPNHIQFKDHIKDVHKRDTDCFCYQISTEKFFVRSKLPTIKVIPKPITGGKTENDHSKFEGTTSDTSDEPEWQPNKFQYNGVVKAMLDDTKPKCYQCEMEPSISEESDPRRHKCLFCKQWFSNHVEFKVHFKEMHERDADCFFSKLSNCNEFTCYICEKDFPVRHYLIAHMKCHHDKFLCHQCPTCGKRYRAYGILTQHMKIHENKTYKCDQCDKVFPYYVRLRMHRLCHNTELNYVCDLCSKGFKMRKYLNRHMTMHSAVKQYACRYCDARFSFTTGRRAHEKSIHNVL